MARRRKPRTRMGKPFYTKRGKYGCYKYVNGRRVAFVEYNKPRNTGFIKKLERKYARK